MLGRSGLAALLVDKWPQEEQQQTGKKVEEGGVFTGKTRAHKRTYQKRKKHTKPELHCKLTVQVKHRDNN